MIRLCINVDHVATLRQARRIDEPDPTHAAVLAESAGADGVTIHLREDRRHIQDRDLHVLLQLLHTPLNLELAAEEEVLAIACETRPYQCTLVPERREEVTTEGGLDVAGSRARLTEVASRLTGAGIRVAMFIDPEPRQVQASQEVGAVAVELHTGAYCGAFESRDPGAVRRELGRLVEATRETHSANLSLHAGHGLNLRNVSPVARLQGLEEVNIGHSIIGRAVLVGMERAVREMREALDRALTLE
jgi:pyridoxine 5-phosphate synthase